MKNKEYLFNYHCFWNGELKYVFENRNVNHYIHLDFLVHILKYRTMDEIIWFLNNDKYTLDFLKENLVHIFYKTNKERLFRNNKFIFNGINRILIELGIPTKKIIYYDKLKEDEILYDNKIKKMTNIINKYINIHQEMLNKERVKNFLANKK